MAVIKPFRGVRYNPALVSELSRVVTQPYDRISPAMHTQYLQQHPYNFVKLILGDPTTSPSSLANPYVGVADLHRHWLQIGVLVRDTQPSFYVYHQVFRSPEGETLRRRALIAALQLTPFEEGIVLPHERTLTAPKEDRLQLFRATQVSFEPIFLLYPDPANHLNALLDAAVNGRAPDLETYETFEHDVCHQMWILRDPLVLEHIQSEMAPKRNLIIADGHHRYETALIYRAEMRAVLPDASLDTGYNYALAALVSLDDPALTILPTHRLVHSYDRLTPAELEAAATAHFTVEPLSQPGQVIALLRSRREKGGVFGFVARDRQSIWTLRDMRIMAELLPDRPAIWRELDVVVLHQLVLERLMGLSAESIARQKNLRYLRDAEEGIRSVQRGEAQFLFLLNPTRVEQVRACAEAGEKMPQKSTDFYPKMVSGLVWMELS
ncbi:MAG: DUF1015 domain-containing protein [Ardenticatenia bacterium]|jgi:uncharacterized protein (DUF1015 family)|nr:MAG: DUF1015 domain-containing protein [Ardenticatenia bacterium]